MKRYCLWLVAALLALHVSVGGVRADSEDEFDETQTHPLRIAAYLMHPVGFALEWVLFRPFHYIVSRPGMDKVFGHRPHGENRAY